MRLRDLEAELVKVVGPQRFRRGVSMAEAQGVLFLCPKCYQKNGGPVGTHRVLCWFKDRGVPEDMPPLPGRWIAAGTGIEDLTFTGPGAASVLLTRPCGG